MPRKLLFSVTAKDCEWKYTRGTGAGGQAKNKTSNAVHCIHRPSGAHGYSEDGRSQSHNRQTAFAQMAKSKEFEVWRQAEARRRTGEQVVIDSNVEREMKKVRVDVKIDGLWQEVNKDAILPDSE